MTNNTYATLGRLGCNVPLYSPLCVGRSVGWMNGTARRNPVASTTASKSFTVPSVKCTEEPFTSLIVGLSSIRPRATALRKSLESVIPGVKKNGIQSAYNASNEPNHAGIAEHVLANTLGAPCKQNKPSL